ncbi:MAG: recombination-associated protein RdgC [Pseudomonadota bacterium]|nr:recombination-associated protein RdgC [Pseudomonadota bacterium]MEC7780699.1 recombination-associated protein RdgC [Pseudomonadota bacterium]MEE2823281.1 recombination-associated protein RdgC [Pseudomonadota bacterium]
MNSNFRNLRVYRIQSEWPESEEALSDLLAAAEFKPCGAFAERSGGFETPVDNSGDLMCRRLAGNDLIQLRVQSRVLPAAAVKEALAERVEEFKQRMHSEPNRAEKRELKEEIYSQLLPQALTRSDRVQAFYLRDKKLLVVGTASQSVAEYLLDNLGRALISLRYLPLVFKQPALDLLTQVFLQTRVDSFSLGRECRMRDPSDSAATVNWLDIDLADPSVRRHVTEGLAVDRLGLNFDQVFRFVLDSDLVVRKLRLADQESIPDEPMDDPLAKHDADFVMLSACVNQLMEGLEKSLGGYPS